MIALLFLVVGSLADSVDSEAAVARQPRRFESGETQVGANPCSGIRGSSACNSSPLNCEFDWVLNWCHPRIPHSEEEVGSVASGTGANCRRGQTWSVYRGRCIQFSEEKVGSVASATGANCRRGQTWSVYRGRCIQFSDTETAVGVPDGQGTWYGQHYFGDEPVYCGTGYCQHYADCGLARAALDMDQSVSDLSGCPYGWKTKHAATCGTKNGWGTTQYLRECEKGRLTAEEAVGSHGGECKQADLDKNCETVMTKFMKTQVPTCQCPVPVEQRRAFRADDAFETAVGLLKFKHNGPCTAAEYAADCFVSHNFCHCRKECWVAAPFQCMGLRKVAAGSADSCQQSCIDDLWCDVYQFGTDGRCWIGNPTSCSGSQTAISVARGGKQSFCKVEAETMSSAQAFHTESAATSFITVVNVFAAIGLSASVYGAFRHYIK